MLSLVSCFSGGVFMGTFLLDLLPDYLGSIAAALEGLRITVRAPGHHWGPGPVPTGVTVPGIGVSSLAWWGGGGWDGHSGDGQ